MFSRTVISLNDTGGDSTLYNEYYHPVDIDDQSITLHGNDRYAHDEDLQNEMVEIDRDTPLDDHRGQFLQDDFQTQNMAEQNFLAQPRNIVYDGHRVSNQEVALDDCNSRYGQQHMYIPLQGQRQNLHNAENHETKFADSQAVLNTNENITANNPNEFLVSFPPPLVELENGFPESNMQQQRQSCDESPIENKFNMHSKTKGNDESMSFVLTLGNDFDPKMLQRGILYNKEVESQSPFLTMDKPYLKSTPRYEIIDDGYYNYDGQKNRSTYGSALAQVSLQTIKLSNVNRNINTLSESSKNVSDTISFETVKQQIIESTKAKQNLYGSEKNMNSTDEAKTTEVAEGKFTASINNYNESCNPDYNLSKQESTLRKVMVENYKFQSCKTTTDETIDNYNANSLVTNITPNINNYDSNAVHPISPKQISESTEEEAIALPSRTSKAKVSDFSRESTTAKKLISVGVQTADSSIEYPAVRKFIGSEDFLKNSSMKGYSLVEEIANVSINPLTLMGVQTPEQKTKTLNTSGISHPEQFNIVEDNILTHSENVSAIEGPVSAVRTRQNMNGFVVDAPATNFSSNSTNNYAVGISTLLGMNPSKKGQSPRFSFNTSTNYNSNGNLLNDVKAKSNAIQDPQKNGNEHKRNNVNNDIIDNEIVDADFLDDESSEKYITEKGILLSPYMLKHGYICLNGKISISSDKPFWYDFAITQDSLNEGATDDIKKNLIMDEKSKIERMKHNETVLLKAAKKLKSTTKKLICINYIPHILSIFFSIFLITRKYQTKKLLHDTPALILSIFMALSAFSTIIVAFQTIKIIKKIRFSVVLMERRTVEMYKILFTIVNPILNLLSIDIQILTIYMITNDMFLRKEFYSAKFWDTFTVPELYVLSLSMLFSLFGFCCTTIGTIMYKRLTHYWLNGVLNKLK